jgi:CRISPR-associated protein Cas2
MHLIVAYDVVDDGRRAKLARSLLGFIDRVQKSVFEGHVPARRLSELMEAIRGQIDHDTDNVRVYHLCRHCVGQVVVVGTATTAPGPPEDEVV